MAGSTAVITVEGLTEFRAALRASEEGNVRQATAAVKEAGKPILARAQSLAPRRSGALASSGTISVQGSTGQIIFAKPYAAGAEWGTKGKWAGFTAAYGDPPRYGYKALDEEGDNAASIIAEQMQSIVTLLGWAT